jgi:hypothetical protein
MTEKTKLQQISDLAFDIQHTNDPQVAFDKAGEILRLTELDQPAFKVGEYYFDKDVNRIVKIEFTEKGYTQIKYLLDGELLDSALYNLADYFKTWEPATAEQMATFKRAEQFAKYGRKLDEFAKNDLVKDSTGDLYVVYDMSNVFLYDIHGEVIGEKENTTLIRTVAEELQEVDNAN